MKWSEKATAPYQVADQYCICGSGDTMFEFLYFGSIFITRFGVGKDLMITNSNGSMKAGWNAYDGKLIASTPYYLSLSPSFFLKEGFCKGKAVSMDGGRYLCRLPIASHDGDPSLSCDYGILQHWLNGQTFESIQFFARQSHDNDSVVAISNQRIQRGNVVKNNFSVSLIHEFNRRMEFAEFAFLPILEPIREYSPFALVEKPVVAVMPGELIHGQLIEASEYDLIVKLNTGKKELALGAWGKWLDDDIVLLDQEQMLNLYPDAIVS